jgi:hypothetical protein
LEELDRALTDYAGAEEDTLDCFLRRASAQLQEFFSAVRQAGGPIAERVLRERAPGLV